MESLEKTGKTVEEAVSEALKELRAERDEVDVTVLDIGSKGIFGLGAKPAKVRVTKKFDPVATAKSFLTEIAVNMGLKVDVTAILKDRQLNVDVKGNDIGVLIGKRGQTLDSLQYLVNLVVNKGDAPYINVILDTENYRQRRKETLEALAINLAKKVKTTRKSVVLEPMSSNERRIIHAVLQNDKHVSTYSEGEEPYRNVVIVYR